jgi:hypothetical protein
MKSLGVLMTSIGLLVVGTAAVIVLVSGGLHAVFEEDGVLEQVLCGDTNRQDDDNYFCYESP